MAQKFDTDVEAEALAADASAMEQWAAHAPSLHDRHVESFERYVAERIRELQTVRDDIVTQTKHILHDALVEVAFETRCPLGITGQGSGE